MEVQGLLKSFFELRVENALITDERNYWYNFGDSNLKAGRNALTEYNKQFCKVISCEKSLQGLVDKIIEEKGSCSILDFMAPLDLLRKLKNVKRGIAICLTDDRCTDQIDIDAISNMYQITGDALKGKTWKYLYEDIHLNGKFDLIIWRSDAGIHNINSALFSILFLKLFHTLSENNGVFLFEILDRYKDIQNTALELIRTLSAEYNITSEIFENEFEDLIIKIVRNN